MSEAADAVIRISRGRGFRDALVAYGVVIDGETVGRVKRAHTVEFSVGPGRHSVRLTLQRLGSEEWDVDVVPGGVASFVCGPGVAAFVSPGQAREAGDRYIDLRPAAAEEPPSPSGPRNWSDERGYRRWWSWGILVLVAWGAWWLRALGRSYAVHVNLRYVVTSFVVQLVVIGMLAFRAGMLFEQSHPSDEVQRPVDSHSASVPPGYYGPRTVAIQPGTVEHRSRQLLFRKPNPALWWARVLFAIGFWGAGWLRWIGRSGVVVHINLIALVSTFFGEVGIQGGFMFKSGALFERHRRARSHTDAVAV